MTWIVKNKGVDGKIASTIKDDFKRAFDLRQEFLSKGIMAWVEDTHGHLVGFQQLNDPIVKG